MPKYDVIIEACITVEADTYQQADEASVEAYNLFLSRVSRATFPYPVYIEQTELLEMGE